MWYNSVVPSYQGTISYLASHVTRDWGALSLFLFLLGWRTTNSKNSLSSSSFWNTTRLQFHPFELRLAVVFDPIVLCMHRLIYCHLPLPHLWILQLVCHILLQLQYNPILGSRLPLVRRGFFLLIPLGRYFVPSSSLYVVLWPTVGFLDLLLLFFPRHRVSSVNVDDTE